MIFKITYHLLFVTSLFLLSTSTQVLAAEKMSEMISATEMSEKVNINQADVEKLATVKGIGSKKAQAIVEYRETHGDFNSLENLTEVKGIGKGTLQKIIPYISI